MDSILTSIKKMLGITADYTHFDDDLIMHINSVFMTLNQLGVGPSEGFYIEDRTTYWDDYIDDPSRLQMIKSYMFMKVKLMFDPPASSTVTKCIEDQIKEFEWRLNVAVDPE